MGSILGSPNFGKLPDDYPGFPVWVFLVMGEW